MQGLEHLVARPKLLLVEDDRDLSGLLAGLLADEDYDVTVPESSPPLR